MSGCFFYCLAFLVVLLFAAVQGANASERTKCSSFGQLGYVAKSGVCRGSSVVTCLRHVITEQRIRKAIQEAVEEDICEPTNLVRMSKTVATEVTHIYVRGLSQIDCNGMGFGCGFLLPKTDNFALAYAQIVLRALRDARIDFCEDDITAESLGMAAAASRGVERVCGYSGDREKAFEDQFAADASTTIAKAIARAFSVECNDEHSPESMCHPDVIRASEGVASVVPSAQFFSNSKKKRHTIGLTEKGTPLPPCQHYLDKYCCYSNSCEHRKLLLPSGPLDSWVLQFDGSIYPSCFCP